MWPVGTEQNISWQLDPKCVLNQERNADSAKGISPQIRKVARSEAWVYVRNAQGPPARSFDEFFLR